MIIGEVQNKLLICKTICIIHVHELNLAARVGCLHGPSRLRALHPARAASAGPG